MRFVRRWSAVRSAVVCGFQTYRRTVDNRTSLVTGSVFCADTRRYGTAATAYRRLCHAARKVVKITLKHWFWSS